MSTQLLIVESPSKAKTLKKYLGPDFEILASYGHVRDLVPKTGAVDTEQGFAMKYQLIERNEKHLEQILKAVKNVDTVLLATDPDREGEAIAWHLAEIIHGKKGLEKKPLKRVVFYEITQNAVKQAVANPREISEALVNAQQARRALDYLVGFNLSPLLWKKIRRGLSAGRVQSPALRLIVEREIEIRAFSSKEYWSIHLDSHQEKQSFSAKLIQFANKKINNLDIDSEAKHLEIVSQLTSKTGRVTRVEKKRKQRHPAPPFTTSTLQQEAVRKLGFTTDRTMKVAQQLYEGVDIGGGAVGLISYMRTDSVNLSQEALRDIRGHITDQFNQEYLPEKPNFYANKTKNAQEAHEAIRPTSIARTPANVKEHLSTDQFRLYEMIWKRTVASQMTQAQFDTVSVDIAVNDGKALFRASGQTLVFPGFIAVYREDLDEESLNNDDDEARLPVLSEGDILDIDRIWGEQHFTQPPPRYTEASLVKALEEFGIGRPSTYASIISTLINRDYVLLDKKRFTPTDVGEVVNKFLTEHFTRYVDYDFTAKLEDQLDLISEGKLEWVPVMEEFWRDFSKQIEDKSQVSRAEVTQEALNEACPQCGEPLMVRLGKRGKFVGCSAYPECNYTRNVDNGATLAEPVLLGEHPTKQLAIYLMNGPYGPYVQLGEVSEDNKKPKRVSIPKPASLENFSIDQGIQLIDLPRELGSHPESNKKVTVNIGRFGPYIQHDGGFRSIPKTDDIFSITLERALEILAQPKSQGRGAIKSLGNHPQDNQAIGVYSGRYGPYVKHGKTNATLPSGTDPENITLEEALALLAEKAGKPASKKKISTKTIKKVTKGATKKSASKKSTTKKTGNKPTTAKKSKATSSDKE
ncbi:MAG: DNA topoisomerase I [Ferrovum sp. 21-44-67]|uniref:type I DNA topoisomerase n=1 Tax=Ferrovum sp. JA12 TaxID=1356299 RepID=UPI0007033421|nr:type I DNA topoisomerase [Ferrovum sp. JA12]KRH79400.1 DNA topoisomerase 1 [Ferrovum sp. JA12]OYV78803.1 MAG: DNA topoisomerase I [Ferrovum sp. 21-44-67]HQT82238.1 type I DNA topoisomerase [Ferrovaceae bacterium]HQU07305.1 type I DNA topoisomerase [Ferrovaceae bacterium]